MEKYTNEGGGELDSTNKDCSRDSLRLKNTINIAIKSLDEQIQKRYFQITCVVQK